MTHTTYQRLSTTLWTVFILFSVLFTQIVFAAERKQSKAHELQQQIEAFVFENLINEDASDIKLNVRKIDRRQKIPDCAEQITFEALNYSQDTSHFSVKASCPEINWFVFVNVSMARLQSVVVATTVVDPGQLLSSHSLEIKRIDVNRLRTTTFLQPEQIIGARAKKRMREGSIITTSMLCFVCKGDRVTITASINGLSIKASGMALEDGNVGDSIKIENITTDKVIVAKVLKQGEVRVVI
ncbi:MAG: flagellar basal body P-ring formation chaperone FlgA [Pseudomonadota bacterium]